MTTRRAERSGRRRTVRPPVPPRNNSRRRLLLPAALVAVALAGLTAGGVAEADLGGNSRPSPSPVNFPLADGTKVYGPLGPEGVPLELGPRLAPPDAGLTGNTIDGIQCNSTEQLVYHHHVHVAVFVRGRPYSVPYGVGMVPPIEVVQTASGPFAEGSSTCLYWTHVHATDGIVHIESPIARDFVLGQVMAIWHVKLTTDQIGAYIGPVTATVNGKVWAGDPNQIPLVQHAQIVINVGGPLVDPPPISWSGTGL